MIFKKGMPPSQNLPATTGRGACGVTRRREETLRMLSIPDMALLGAAALMFFGPEQLPKVARKVGLLVRDVQNTSQTFIREMERAADEGEDGAGMTRGHLLEEPVPGFTAPTYPHDSGVYGAYDGGYVASPSAHDVPVEEAPAHHALPAEPAAPALEHATLPAEVHDPTP